MYTTAVTASSVIIPLANTKCTCTFHHCAFLVTQTGVFSYDALMVGEMEENGTS